MPVVKLTRRDWTWPAIFLALGALGVVAAVVFFHQAFPEASIDLKLSREQIVQRADTWLQMRGLSTSGYRRVVLFDPEQEGKTYLERELGLEEANRQMTSGVEIWRWRVRYIQPPQKEELTVQLNPAGELVGFQHLIEEQAAGPKLGKEEAQRIAEIFLRSQKGVSLADYTLVEDELQGRPNRNDYNFTWERNGFKLRDATYRLGVTIQGDQVGGYREFVKVPEQWSRNYRSLRSRNDLLQNAATVFYVPLLIAAIIVLIRVSQARRTWRAALWIGGLVGVLFAALTINQFPNLLSQLPTNATYSTLFAMIVFGALISGFFIALYVGAQAAAGAPLYEEMVPGRIRLRNLFSFRALQTREYFVSTLIGYGMAALHIGAVVVFYVIARRFGAWAPLEVNYDNALSTPLPWLYPLAVSLFASTSEEFGFRLFAIPLLHRWLKSKWLAILIPAFIWGFLHSSYPQQPAWLRGVEVGLIGVLAGWVMVRFGILATLIWHYTVDAVLIGMFLIRAENLYYRVIGALVGDAVLIPLVIGLVLYWQNRGFVEDETILNRPAGAGAAAAAVAVSTGETTIIEPPKPAAPAVEPPAPGLPLDARRKRLALVAALAGVVLLIAVRAPRLGDFVRYTVTRSDAERAAVEHLRRQGVAVDSFRRATTLWRDLGGSTGEYLRQHKGIEGANKIYSEQVPSVFWRTRFFKPSEKEEFAVYVSLDGKVARLGYTQAENAPGPTLDLPAAQERASAHLRERGVNLSQFRLVESNLEKRPARHDFTFVWEEDGKLAGEAHRRITAGLVGDRVTGPVYSVKVPEAWQRDYGRARIGALVAASWYVLLGILAMIYFGRRIGQVTLRWRLYITAGVIFAIGVTLGQFLTTPGWMAGYNTSVPWTNAVIQRVLTMLLTGMAAFIGVAMLAMAADVLLAVARGQFTLLPAPGSARAAWLRQAMLLGTCAAAALAGVQSAARALAERIPAAVTSVSVPSVDNLSSVWPAGSALLSALSSIVTLPLLFGAVAGLAFVWLKTPGRIALLLLLTAVATVGEARSAGDFARSMVRTLPALAAFGGTAWLLGRNTVAYMVLFGWLSLGGAIAGFAAHPALRTDAWVLGSVALVAAAALHLWAGREAALQPPAERQWVAGSGQ